MHNTRVELLAPAGNKAAFYGAIHAGADAVYLGGNRFGARAYADNFTEEELISCIRYAHIWGRRVYLTVNTLVKESELNDLYDYLKPFYEAGLDGVIIQDIGVFSYIREHFPDIELHVSTQMTITGKYGAKLLKDMGAKRIVPARELSLSEIKIMKEYADLEIETFIHGAMCYCYSGQCLFSSVLGGRSGNRGRCAQPCRLPFTVKAQHQTYAECYPLSLKDMCTIEQLPVLIAAGIDSFKIEGRMKKPEYAAGVTAIYRKYIDKYYVNPGKEFKVSGKDLDKLSKLYIRSERQNGYYFKHNGKDMVTLDSPAYSGSEEALLTDIRSRYLEKAPKLPVSVYGYFQTGEEASVTYIAGDLSVTVCGEIVQEASRQSISSENVEKQLCKLGETVFHAEEINITLSDNAFYSLKALNELRREAVAKLENLIIEEHGLVVSRALPEICEETPQTSLDNKYNQKITKSLHVSVQTFEQLTALAKSAYADTVSRIYLNGDMIYQNPERLLSVLVENHHFNANKKVQGIEIIISFPYILRHRDNAYLEAIYDFAIKHSDVIHGFRVSTMETMGFLKNKGYDGAVYTDAGFYIWNSKTLEEWSQSIAGFCLPYELKSGEQRGLLQNCETPCEKIFYGRIPMMITANCVAKTTDQCLMQKTGDCTPGQKKSNADAKDTQSLIQLTDRYNKNFPVALNCIHCTNIIYNSVPMSLHGEWNKWKQATDMRLDFTIENEGDVLKILEFFGSIYTENPQSSTITPPFKEYTTGHEKRGVE